MDGAVSRNNTTIRLLGAGETFTGVSDLSPLPDVMVSCFSSSDGTLYFDFSVDGVNWRTFPTDGIQVQAGIHEFHTAVKGSRYFRIRFVNSDTAQTAFQLFTYFGQFRQPNAPLNQTISQDADALITRTIGSEIDISLGRFSGVTIEDKFGINTDITSTLEDVWSVGGILSWPTSAVSLEVLSSSTDDSSSGTGAQQIQISGLDANWEEQTATVTMNGTNVVAVSGVTWMRVYRARVIRRGTYTSANAGTITIRIAGAGSTLCEIPVDPTRGGLGTSQMTHFTIPAGKTGLLQSYIVNVESNKPCTVFGNIRTNADDVSSPYSGALFPPITLRAVQGVFERNRAYPYALPEKTDIWTSAYATGGTTGFVSVNYKLILVDAL